MASNLEELKRQEKGMKEKHREQVRIYNKHHPSLTFLQGTPTTTCNGIGYRGAQGCRALPAQTKGAGGTNPE
jgi:hypothetical protein